MATTKTKTEKIIEDITYASSNQSISRRVIYEFKNLKVMLELKSDSYRGQCYARASVLDNLEWRVIYFIPHAEMRTPEGLCHYIPYRDTKAEAIHCVLSVIIISYPTSAVDFQSKKPTRVALVGLPVNGLIT